MIFLRLSVIYNILQFQCSGASEQSSKNEKYDRIIESFLWNIRDPKFQHVRTSKWLCKFLFWVLMTQPIIVNSQGEARLLRAQKF